jgi:hypothetical protein
MTDNSAGVGPVERGVGRPEPGRDNWQHLKPYGYAPGNYLSRCHRCKQIADGVDKYAITCRPCAEAMHDAA